MMQTDFITETAPKPFKDIGNKHAGVAEEKARLLLALGKLINRIPPSIAGGGSVQSVRHYRDDVDNCRKVARNPRSSTSDINSAISRMQKWHDAK